MFTTCTANAWPQQTNVSGASPSRSTSMSLRVSMALRSYVGCFLSVPSLSTSFQSHVKVRLFTVHSRRYFMKLKKGLESQEQKSRSRAHESFLMLSNIETLCSYSSFRGLSSICLCQPHRTSSSSLYFAFCVSFSLKTF